MAFDLSTYFLEHAIRLQRNNWGGGGTEMLGQEIFSLMSGIQKPPKKLEIVDQSGNPYQVPPYTLPTFDPVALDLDFPENPIAPPVTFDPSPNPTGVLGPTDFIDPTAANSGIGEREFWKRQVFPGLIKANLGDGKFTITLRKNGFAPESILPHLGSFDPEDDAEEKFEPIDVEATLTDATLAGQVEIGTWTWVFMAARYSETVTITNGQPQIVQVKSKGKVQYLFNANAGGGGLAITTSIISARATDPRSDPGTGTGILRPGTRDPISGVVTWSDGEETALYNSTSSEVGNGKLIQWKFISGLRFVDVEDCGA